MHKMLVRPKQVFSWHFAVSSVLAVPALHCLLIYSHYEMCLALLHYIFWFDFYSAGKLEAIAANAREFMEFVWAVGCVVYIISFRHVINDWFLQVSFTTGKRWDLYYSIFPNIPLIFIQPFVLVWKTLLFGRWLYDRWKHSHYVRVNGGHEEEMS